MQQSTPLLLKPRFSQESKTQHLKSSPSGMLGRGRAKGVLSRQEVIEKVKLGEEKLGRNAKQTMDHIMSQGYILEGFGDTVKEVAKKNYSNGAIRGAPAQMNEDIERNDNLIPRANPRFKVGEGESPSAGKMIGNALPSAYNVISDVANMALNPYDTAKGLLNMAKGASYNAAKGIIGGITGDSEGKIDSKLNRISTMRTPMGWLVRNLKHGEGTADAVWGALEERYGGADNIAKTMTEDPFGMISDIAGIVEGGATLIKTGARSSKLASLAKVADKADDVARLANAADPYNMGMRGVAKATGGTIKGVANTMGTIRKSAQELAQKTADNIIGLDSQTVQSIKANPYTQNYRENTIEMINQEGVPTDLKQLKRQPLEELGGELISIIDERKKALSDSGPLYKEVRKLNTEIPMDEAHTKLQEILNNNSIKVNEEGRLDFTNSKYIQGSDISAIQSVYDRIMQNSSLTVDGVLNLRKAVDSARKRDGAPVSSSNLLSEMRGVVDDVAKEKVPQLREIDELYSSQIKELNQIQDGLVYRQGDRKGQIRDNFQSIIKNLGGENRAAVRNRLLEVMPDIDQRVAAINMMPDIAKAYTKTPGLQKIIGTVGVGGLGYAVGGNMGGVVGTALASYFGDEVLKSVRQSQIQKIFSEVSPEAQKRLAEINEAMEANQALRQSEIDLLNSIKNKLQEEANKVDDTTNVAKDTSKVADDIAVVPDNNTTPKVSAGVNDELIKKAKEYKTAKEFIDDNTNMYHGTDKKFHEFDPKKIGTKTDPGLYGRGFYFSPSESYAKNAPRGGAKEIMKVRVNMDNLYDVSKYSDVKEVAELLNIEESVLKKDSQGRVRPILQQVNQFTSHLQDLGYEGVMVPNNGKIGEVVVFDAKKILTESQLEDIWKEANESNNVNPKDLTKLDLDEADTVFLERSKTLRDIASKYNDYDSFLNDVLKVRGMSNYYVAQKYGKEYLPLLNATTDYGKISNIEQIKKIWDTAKSDSFSKAGSATSAIMEDDIISKRAEYEVAKNELDSFIDKIADEFDSKGIKTSLKFLDKEGNIRQGGVDRIMQKAKDKGGIENVTDISRGSVLVKTRSSVNKLVKYLERNGYIVDNKFAQPTKLGYSDASILFESSNGIQSELQIHIPEILVAKEGENVVKYGFMSQDQYTRIVERAGVEGGLGHKYYEEWRELDTLEDTPDTIVKKKEIESKSKEYYDKFILSLK